MGNCGSCSGNCANCSGCARELVLSQARKMGELTPVYLERGEDQAEHYSLILQCLEKKGLISLDYDKPMKCFDDTAYAAYPIRGSMSLTQRGQAVLEMLEIQGAGEEI